MHDKYLKMRLNATSVIRQQGYFMSEYLVGTALVAFAMFTPMPGIEESVFVFFVNALKDFQANSTYMMSLP